MNRGKRIERLVRQMTKAQQEVGEAVVRVAGAPNDRVDTAVAITYMRIAIATAERAKRGLELLAREQENEMRALDKALR